MIVLFNKTLTQKDTADLWKYPCPKCDGKLIHCYDYAVARNAVICKDCDLAVVYWDTGWDGRIDCVRYKYWVMMANNTRTKLLWKNCQTNEDFRECPLPTRTNLRTWIQKFDNLPQ